MHIYKRITIIGAAFTCLLLTACGGGSNSPLDAYNNISSTSSLTSSSNSNTSTSSVDSVIPEKLGSGFGTTFVEGVINTGIADNVLSAGGTTTLTVNVVSSTNTLVTSDVEITFNSKCLAAGEAIFTNELGEPTGKMITSNGEASILYTAKGCVGPDLITASTTINNSKRTAQTTLNVEAGTVGSIKFIDADPMLVSLAGTGGQETSIVRFQVLSNNNNNDPVKGVDVNFSLNTSVGGISLSTTTAKTDKQGFASTTVKAGTIHTSVRVTATTGVISSQSDQLVISTGIPDQDSMSIAATVTNPVGWDIQGVESIITTRLADAFNNPPPEGTTVALTTEGGSIDDSCQTTKEGACVATWRSQNPKIFRNSPDNTPERRLCVNASGYPINDYVTCRKERAGRTTLLAAAIGNESFIDSGTTNDDLGNGTQTGKYDLAFDKFKTKNSYSDVDQKAKCDANAPLSSSQVPTTSLLVACDDLAEAYIDKNENEQRDNDEEYVDFNNDHSYGAANSLYNGILCTTSDEEAGKCSRQQVTIRQEMVLVVTSHHLLMRQGVLPFINTNIIVPTGLSGATWFWLADENGNGVPQGTTLSLDTTNLTDGKADISPKGPLPASEDPIIAEVSITASSIDKTPTGSISIKIKRTAPAPVGDITNEYTVYVNQIQ